MELFLYYNLPSVDKSEIILSVFNEKLSFATEVAIRHGVFNDDENQYKFVFRTYTCVCFTVSSFDKNAEDWDSDLFDCAESADALQQSTRPKEYEPVTQGAQYLGLVKVVFSGNDLEDSAEKVTALSSLLQPATNASGTNSTATRRLLSEDSSDEETALPTAIAAFIDFCEQCMNSEPGFLEHIEAGCDDFLGLDLDDFKSMWLRSLYVAEWHLYKSVVSLEASKSLKIVAVVDVITLGEQIVSTLKYIIYVFVAICFAVSILGKLSAKRIGSDNGMFVR